MRQLVGADTCFSSTSATSRQISCRYRLGFSKTTPTMNISSQASSFLKDSLAGCFLPLTSPVSSNLLNAVRAVLVAILKFLAISRKDSPIPRCCQITLQRISGEYAAFLLGSADLTLDIALTDPTDQESLKCPPNVCLWHAQDAVRNTQ